MSIQEGTISGKPNFDAIEEARRKAEARANSRRKVVLPESELSKLLETAQTAWRNLGVEPLSFITNSERILEMNSQGMGGEIREMAKGYSHVKDLPQAEGAFCLLPSYLEPQVQAMSQVWEVNYRASSDRITQASTELRLRNEQGFGAQLTALFEAIPSITRTAIKNAMNTATPTPAIIA